MAILAGDTPRATSVARVISPLSASASSHASPFNPLPGSPPLVLHVADKDSRRRSSLSVLHPGSSIGEAYAAHVHPAALPVDPPRTHLASCQRLPDLMLHRIRESHRRAPAERRERELETPELHQVSTMNRFSNFRGRPGFRDGSRMIEGIE